MAEQQEEFRSPKYIFHGFMERLWAYLTIQQLLEKMWVARTPEDPLGGHTWPQGLPELLTSGVAQLAWGISEAWRGESWYGV